MVCSISPYFTDEELMATMRMCLPNYYGMWLYNWEHILSSIKEGPVHFWVILTFSDGSRKKLIIDKITGGVKQEAL